MKIVHHNNCIGTASLRYVPFGGDMSGIQTSYDYHKHCISFLLSFHFNFYDDRKKNYPTNDPE